MVGVLANFLQTQQLHVLSTWISGPGLKVEVEGFENLGSANQRIMRKLL